MKFYKHSLLKKNSGHQFGFVLKMFKIAFRNKKNRFLCGKILFFTKIKKKNQCILEVTTKNYLDILLSNSAIS